MPKRIPIQAVCVQRNGKKMWPKIGQPFEFTDAEVEHFQAIAPESMRKLVNEEKAPVSEPPAAVKPPKGSDDGKSSDDGKKADSGTSEEL